MAIKVDISKAHGTLSWDYMWAVLLQFGCDNRFIACVRTIVSSANISILVNGGPVGYFQPTRGLSQGDPFPYYCLL